MSELPESYRKQGYWTDHCLTDYFDRAVSDSPDKVAVIDRLAGRVTYGQLASDVYRLAASLQARGVSAGDRFIVALPNWHQVSAFVLALGYLGAVVVHMPLGGREHEFAGVIKTSGAGGIVVPAYFHDVDYVALVDSVAAGFATLTNKVTIGADTAPAGWVSYGQLLAESPEDQPRPDIHVDADAITTLLFTSGSSGDPKGVAHSSNSIGAYNVNIASVYSFGPEDIIFMGTPLGFSGGLIHGVRFAIYLGATLVLQETWNGDEALEIMAQEKATFTMVTPTLLRDLLRSDRFAVYADRLRLRLVLCGGSYTSAELLREAYEKLPGTLTSTVWGMTEGFGTACDYDTPLDRLFETDGKALPGSELRILRADGSDAAAGEEGDLVLRGPHLFLGYYNRPDLDEEFFLADRWFQTGDVAAIDADGYIRITGRRKALIIRGGANISPEEIEARFQDDPRIAHFAVVGVPDERLGECVCACVVLSQDCESLQLEDLQEIARRQGLAKYKWPERMQLMDALPLTPSKKIRRGILRDTVHTMMD